MPSLAGEAIRLVYDSMAWVRASIPVGPPTDAGRAVHKAASKTPARGAIRQLTTGSLLREAGLVSTANGVTSLPVP